MKNSKLYLNFFENWSGLLTRYIDQQTAKIDQLIENYQKLIALSKEKRTALITHCVTKGLDPTVKMKDSGVEWLGEVPEKWNISKFRFLGKAIIGLTYSPNDVADENNGTLVLRSSNIQNGIITFDDNVYVSSKISEKLTTKKGDILICSRNGSRKLIGKNAMIDDNSSGLSFGAFTIVFRSDNVDNRYLYWVFNSSLFEYQSGSFLTTTINQLTTGNINDFESPYPPIQEQTTIANYLDQQTAKIDQTIEKAEKAIELLKEKRTALITAVVTGKVDVRECV